jgi:transcriptional regulator with XRE-family HTH domain
MTRPPFADRLVSARRARGLTQAALATRVGVHVMMVSAWERGLNQPRLHYLTGLAGSLEVTLDWLCGLSADGGPDNVRRATKTGGARR